MDLQFLQNLIRNDNKSIPDRFAQGTIGANNYAKFIRSNTAANLARDRRLQARREYNRKIIERDRAIQKKKDLFASYSSDIDSYMEDKKQYDAFNKKYDTMPNVDVWGKSNSQIDSVLPREIPNEGGSSPWTRDKDLDRVNTIEELLNKAGNLQKIANSIDVGPTGGVQVDAEGFTDSNIGEQMRSNDNSAIVRKNNVLKEIETLHNKANELMAGPLNPIKPDVPPNVVIPDMPVLSQYRYSPVDQINDYMESGLPGEAQKIYETEQNNIIKKSKGEVTDPTTGIVNALLLTKSNDEYKKVKQYFNQLGYGDVINSLPEDKNTTILQSYLQTKIKPKDALTFQQNVEKEKREKEEKEIKKIQDDLDKLKPENVSIPQWKSAGYAIRMEEASKGIEELLKNGYKPSEAFKGAINELMLSSSDPTMWSRAWDTFTKSTVTEEDDQQWLQYARNFINAKLRDESGAAIAASEFVSAINQYLPGIGEVTPGIRKQKLKNRQQVIAGMTLQAGDVAMDNIYKRYDALKKGKKIKDITSKSLNKTNVIKKNFFNKVKVLKAFQKAKKKYPDLTKDEFYGVVSGAKNNNKRFLKVLKDINISVGDL